MPQTVLFTVALDEAMPENTSLLAELTHLGCNGISLSKSSLLPDSSERLRPDAVLLDVDNEFGRVLDICTSLSKHAQTASIPVLLLGTHPTAEWEQKAWDAGAADCLNRPVSSPALVARLRSRIRTWKGRSVNQAADRIQHAADELALSPHDLGRILMDALPDICFVKDVTGRFVYCNPAFEKLYGLKAAHVIGQTDHAFLSKPQARHFEWEDQKVLTSGQSVSSLAWQTTANGQKVLYETLKTPVVTEDGRALGLMGLGRDITKWKASEDALQHINSLGPDQQIVLASHAHDLLADAVLGLESRLVPLVASGILINSTLAQELEKLADQFGRNKVNKTQFGEYLHKTRQGFVMLDNELQKCNRLADTLNRLTWVSQVQDFACVNLSEIVQSAARHNLYKATAEGIDITVRIDAEVHVRGNITTWQFIATQLIENALTHAFPDTRRGNLTLIVAQDGQHASLTVADDGIGLSVGPVRDIFKPYFSTGDATQNAGMGLPLIRHIVEGHLNGQVYAQASEGSGLTLCIRLPLSSPAPQSGL